jgi:4-hydroxy 2-oxovalerate aldolase
MNMTEAKESRARHWLSYRSELKVLDCTVRDGGLMNDHGFDDKTVKAIYQACVEAGIDYMEFGYKASKRIFAPSQFGPWKFCSEDDIRRIVGDNETGLKISVMADAERTDYHEDILPREQSAIDMIRVATYIHQIPTAIDMVKDAHDKGYETCVNLMAVSTVQEWELDEALEIMADSEAGAIILVDSFGSFYSEQIQYLMRKYLRHAIPRGKMVGMHAHNNQQLAFANTIETIILGANMLDGSMAGLGRGAGNCPMELLLGFLHNPKYRLRPVLECIRDHVEPLRTKLRWGPDIPYMITGILNQHPRPAMQFNASADQADVVKFFDMMIEEE